MGSPRHCLYNAAVGLTGPLVHEVAVDDFARVITVDLVGTFISMRAELAAMLESGSGSIVNVSSNLGAAAVSGQSAYVSAKHGVLGLTKAAALEYATKGIRVNAVLPGVVETPAVAHLARQDPDRILRLRAQHPMGRFAKTREVAEAIIWLASSRSSFTTGAAIEIDGGYLAQ